MNIIFHSCTENYPVQFSANNTKIGFLAKGLVERGNTVSIVNRYTGYSKIAEDSIGKTNTGIEYVIFSRKKKNILWTIISHITTSYKYLASKKIKNESNILIVDTGYSIFYLINVIMAKIFRYKIVHIITEWPLAFKQQMKWYRKLDARIYVSIFGYLCDAILPISDKLIVKIQKFNKPFLKTPVLASYDIIKNISAKDTTNYFAFCGNAGYSNIIDFILNSFKMLLEKKHSLLKLVLYGKWERIEYVKKRISLFKLNDFIEIKSGISELELKKIYTEACGLLIPLDPASTQDENRFPQKIAEYLSSSTPIITTNVGAIKEYFINKKNAYIVDFTEKAYANAMLDILESPQEAKVIGMRGYELGYDNFDYSHFSVKLNSFLSQL